MSGFHQLSRGTILFLLFLLAWCASVPAVEATGQHENPGAAAQSSELAQVEMLVEQGRMGEAKASTVEYLKLHPSQHAVPLEVTLGKPGQYGKGRPKERAKAADKITVLYTGLCDATGS